MAQIEAHTDPRAARYWQLVAIVTGTEGAYQDRIQHASTHIWLMDALRHYAR